jgi:RecJ-like exonuclease
VNEKDLLKISLISSLIGILLLFILTYEMKVNFYEINSLSKDNIDDAVRIKGIVESFAETPGLYIVTIKDDTGAITVVIFKDESLNLQKGMELEIIGTVTEYNNKLEIILKEIVP